MKSMLKSFLVKIKIGERAIAFLQTCEGKDPSITQMFKSIILNKAQ